jgi:hypothetical protein
LEMPSVLCRFVDAGRRQKYGTTLKFHESFLIGLT